LFIIFNKGARELYNQDYPAQWNWSVVGDPFLSIFTALLIFIALPVDNRMGIKRFPYTAASGFRVYECWTTYYS